MTSIRFDSARAADRWQAFVSELPLRAIRSEADYAQMVTLMNQLLDVVGDDESHPLAPVLALVGDQVEAYDATHFALARSEPRETLKFLMDQHGLKQADLAELVAQPNLSAILNGRRAISRELAKGLAKRFHVPVSVFL